MKLDQLEKFIAPLKRRVLQTVARALIKTIADDKGLQKLQVELLADEVHSNVDRVQEYGFTSAPLPGAEGVFVAVGGSREHGVIIAIDDRRYRLKNLAPGEVALYTDEGDKIHFKRGKKIEINSGAEINLIATNKVTATAPNIEATATTKIKATSPLVEVIASTKVTMTTPLAEVSGNIVAAGMVVASGFATTGITPVAGEAKVANIRATGVVEDANGTMQEMRDTYNGHTHPENGAGGGTTSAPNESMN